MKKTSDFLPVILEVSTIIFRATLCILKTTLRIFAAIILVYLWIMGTAFEAFNRYPEDRHSE